MAGAIPRGFLDARTVDDARELVCDVCIVGSGAAGTTLALRMRERGRSVLMLEAGGGGPDPKTDSLLDLETADLPIGAEARQRFLGGTTNSWWGGSAMLDDVDFGPRPWLGVPSWPIDRAELIPYYAQSCRLLGVPDLTAIGIERFRQGKGFLVRSRELDSVVFYWPKRPRRFRETLEAAVISGRGLDAYLYANVTRIIMGVDGSRAEGLEVCTVNGRRFIVRAKVVVLACGGIENARLLLVSGGGRGVGDGRSATGKYYMDHPKGVVGMVMVDPNSKRMPHPAYWDSRPGRFRLGIRLSPDRQERDGLLDGYLRFHPILASHGRGTAAMRAIYRRRFAAFRDPSLLGDVARGIPELIAFARFKAFNRGAVHKAEIHNFLEQAPREENRVTLSDRLDLFGNPLTKLEWSIGELDKQTMRTLHAALDEDLRGRGLGRVDSPILPSHSGDEEPWPISRDASHHMGTTRMGDDPSTSVVDRNCRVHGVENLYVAGSSVFSSTGFANPTLTIVALALRLADQLAGR